MEDFGAADEHRSLQLRGSPVAQGTGTFKRGLLG